MHHCISRRQRFSAALLASLSLTTLFVPGAIAAPLAATPQNAAPADSGRTVTVPFQLEGGHIYLEAKVNGKKGRFVLDSGAGATVLTPEGAKRLELPLSDQKIRANGAGAVQASLTKIEKLEIGGAKMRDDFVVVLPLPPQLKVDGLLGYGFFSKFIVTLDYEKRQLTLAYPDGYQEPTSTTSLKLELQNNIPFIAGEVDGIPGLFRLDTGSNAALSLFAPFVEENGLRNKYKPRIETVVGRGVGGLLYGDLVRIPSLKLGDVEVRSLITDLSRQTTGAFFDKKIAGNIGSEVLHRFTVTFNYPGKKLYLTPNRLYKDPFPQGRSGLGVDLQDNDYVVIAVVPDSPATEAGLKVGDVVLALDGVGVNKLKSTGIQESFRRPAGTTVELLVRSAPDEKPRKVTLTLRDLL
jgi:clan AA aspartic protease (TIGR02281 family)